MRVLTREELLEAVRQHRTILSRVYLDVANTNRYGVSPRSSEFWPEDAELLDEEFGGDWMPLGTTAELRFYEEAMYGTYCGDPV